MVVSYEDGAFIRTRGPATNHIQGMVGIPPRERLRMKPAYDGIVGWLLVLAGLFVLIIGWDAAINGADLFALVVFGAGVAMVGYRVGRNDN